MKQYLVDAFSKSFYRGNPAIVCFPEQEYDDGTFLSICRENGVPDTVFAIDRGNGTYELRYFTPSGEITLCGHSTLACAYVLLKLEHPEYKDLCFKTKEGDLSVRLKDDRVSMDFPAFKLKPVQITQQMIDAIGATPLEAYMGRDLLCVFEDEETILNLDPDIDKLMKLDGLLLQVTAPGTKDDCVSRSFSPKLGVPEDPVCGSGHCHIIPYWFQKTGKTEFVARQASPRGGILYCLTDGERVTIAGDAVVYSKGEILL